MFRTSFRRSKRSRYLRVVFLLVFLLCAVDLISILSSHMRQQLLTPTSVPSQKKERIYIASIHWNNEAVLRSKWIEAVVNTIKVLGPENFYVSVYESGSWDDTKGALRVLNSTLEDLGVQRSIILDESTHLDEISKPPGSSQGWIDTSRGKRELRRIPYLAKLRNISLKPLADLALRGIKFDKILFLNDVVFTTEDVINLLATREGNYAAACSLDFSKPPDYYDTFALRDLGGYETVTSTFPYFRHKASRNAMISGRPVPVQSCWNGIVSFTASPFYTTNPPLEFRSIPDSLAHYHLEASECCLIHADNPLSSTSHGGGGGGSGGVWLNPNVRVGYNVDAYAVVHHQEINTTTTPWPPLAARIRGIWWNRIKRWTIIPLPTLLKARKVNTRLKKWKDEDEGNVEKGVQCLINEMQVLVKNGWAHV